MDCFLKILACVPFMFHTQNAQKSIFSVCTPRPRDSNKQTRHNANRNRNRNGATLKKQTTPATKSISHGRDGRPIEPRPGPPARSRPGNPSRPLGNPRGDPGESGHRPNRDDSRHGRYDRNSRENPNFKFKNDESPAAAKTAAAAAAFGAEKDGKPEDCGDNADGGEGGRHDAGDRGIEAADDRDDDAAVPAAADAIAVDGAAGARRAG